MPFMQELHRVAKAVFRVPYGSSDDAFENPTHVRRCFMNTFGYFSQPFFWRADYGYRGDWKTERIRLLVSKKRHQGKSLDSVMEEVMHLRNVVREMTLDLVAVKPIRAAKMELQSPCKVEVILVDP